MSAAGCVAKSATEPQLIKMSVALDVRRRGERVSVLAKSWCGRSSSGGSTRGRQFNSSMKTNHVMDKTQES